MTAPDVGPEMQAHPVAKLFPAMDDVALAALARDIHENGLLNPIITHKGLILDGRNRLAACVKAGVEPRYVEWDGTGGSPTEFVVSANIHRRHLTSGQRAMLAQELLPRLEAEARARQGTRGDLTSGQSCPEVVADEPHRARRDAAALVGCSERLVQDAKKIKKANPRLARKVRDGVLTTAQALRGIREKAKEERRQANAAAVQVTAPIVSVIGTARFSTILIDPPWDWRDEGYESEFGRKQPPYATLSIEQIRALPVADLSDVDCHLYLWTTNRIVPKARELLETWGFRFASMITWIKPEIGLGTYFRNSTEQVLVGVKGQQALRRHDVGTWFTAPPGPRGHSSKPEEFYELIESCSPGPYLEMFARGHRPEWTAWGAEAGTEASPEVATSVGIAS